MRSPSQWSNCQPSAAVAVMVTVVPAVKPVLGVTVTLPLPWTAVSIEKVGGGGIGSKIATSD